MPGELPPPYDWVPTAQRERNAEELLGSVAEANDSKLPCTEEPMGTLQLPPSYVGSEERPSYCLCYTLSLGMKKTKAQHTLPHPYHVQNLIRAMANRLPEGPEEAPSTAA